ncbi:MAG: DNA methyltransferase [Planctomycetota bacterium]
MATDKRKVLGALSAERLKEIATAAELEPLFSRSKKQDVVDALAKARRVSWQAIVEGEYGALSRDELKDICEALGLDTTGRARQVLIDRILGGELFEDSDRGDDDSPDAGDSGDDPPGDDDLVDDDASAGVTNEAAAAGAGVKGSISGRLNAAGGVSRPRSATEGDYRHRVTSPMRPEIGSLPQFPAKKRKQPKTYRYDSSLAPELNWDGQNPAREFCEWLLALIVEAAAMPAPQEFKPARQFCSGDGRIVAEVGSLKEAVELLRRQTQPFLEWTGKAEQLSFDVPTLPLFVHERFSTEAIIATLHGHRKKGQTRELFEIFDDPRLEVGELTTKAYEFPESWKNRLILGDSLSVMNSLAEYEQLGGQVQMIFMDPPYGVKFGSNFQPFVRKRDVKHNDDDNLTREPEMVQAYRDTWELGVHSYLTYIRDRLVLARTLLHNTGSIFVQISEENVHRVRAVMDEVFGPENRLTMIVFRKTTGAGSPSGYVEALPETIDYLLWYAKDRPNVRINRLYVPRDLRGDPNFRWIEEPSGERRRLSSSEDVRDVPLDCRVFQPNPLTSQTGGPTTQFPVTIGGKVYRPAKGGWKTNSEGMERLKAANRLIGLGNTLRFIRYHSDFPFVPVIDVWDDTRQSGFGEEKTYVVQTASRVVERCIHLTTRPGDLVLDPTCGSGTTAYMAEHWGRRWITIDVSRVPLALARQRLLTATFPWFDLQSEDLGPAGGFLYQRKTNRKGEEIGGLVPHVTLKSIATGEKPVEEIMVDRPEINSNVVRVSGPFVFEGTIPAPDDIATVLGEPSPASEDDAPDDSDATGDHVSRMIDVLRRAPVLNLGPKHTVTLGNIRRPSRTQALHAEASLANGAEQRCAIVFGPASGAVSQDLIWNAGREANARNYRRLLVIGFAISESARDLIEQAGDLFHVEATWVAATPDLMMGDLLKNMRSSQVFSVCGLPDVKVHKPKEKGGQYQVELLGLDVFDPATMESTGRKGDDVPAWFLDTDYNGRVFHVCQAFFPRTGAWEKLKKALKATHDETVWDHLAGTKSAPFERGKTGKIAVKVIDDRGNELLAVKSL